MWSGGVVELSEVRQQRVQFGDGLGAGLRGEPAFEGLLEPFDLALGLRVGGVAVLLLDVKGDEQVFEAVSPAGES